MNTLNGKHIILGISGGIAAYKSAELTRRLRDAGAQVRVVMTRSATEFVTPLTFQALSGNPVHTELLDEKAEAGMGHIQLARWADAILIAPASANCMAKLAQGRADDLLTTLCLASGAPLALAPAMNRVMWSDTATQNNLLTLKQRGVHLFGPVAGSQACGETGDGRMLEVPDLVDALSGLFKSGVLQGKHVLVTAGPTYEAIDPVRFIGNRSSGRMGFAIANAAREAGASVTLISGPSLEATPEDVNRIDVETAAQMYEAVMQQLRQHQIFIAAAAVADYRPKSTSRQKLKKHAEELSIELERTEDILAAVASSKPRPFAVGFAAETENLLSNARAKLENKSLDMIAANLVGKDANAQDIGFNNEYNALHVLWGDGEQVLEQARKTTLARELVKLVAHHYNKNRRHEKNSA
ncbi:MAG: bifunctional phosphopantothenoylcysteine decarboxylase/phosphopantothenate--cysteine ligase CoaBC [Thiotrichales bacterium]|nr:MAG: bifunctional phosphopantothenoylcysteine decarboxylase/phosphopantothenate--cysteine ligase CoaBC [Thiotrichales bacterium]